MITNESSSTQRLASRNLPLCTPSQSPVALPTLCLLRELEQALPIPWLLRELECPVLIQCITSYKSAFRVPFNTMLVERTGMSSSHPQRITKYKTTSSVPFNTPTIKIHLQLICIWAQPPLMIAMSCPGYVDNSNFRFLTCQKIMNTWTLEDISHDAPIIFHAFDS